MHERDESTATKRQAQLRAVANAYFEGLARKDVSAVPYDDDVVLRAPLAPGGSENPLRGKKAAVDYLTSLFPVLGEVRVIEHYINEEMTAICTEAFIGVTNPRATLRVADRFAVNTAGKIIDQENHYDPRPALPPG